MKNSEFFDKQNTIKDATKALIREMFREGQLIVGELDILLHYKFEDEKALAQFKIGNSSYLTLPELQEMAKKHASPDLLEFLHYRDVRSALSAVITKYNGWKVVFEHSRSLFKVKEYIAPDKFSYTPGEKFYEIKENNKVVGILREDAEGRFYPEVVSWFLKHKKELIPVNV